MKNKDLIDLTYETYDTNIRESINILTDRYNNVKKSREFFSYNCLNNQQYVAKNNTDYHIICNSIKDNTITYNKLVKIQTKLTDVSYLSKINTINDKIVDSNTIMLYFKNLLTKYILEYKLEYKIEYYNSIIIDKTLFSVIYKNLYFNISRSLLNGNSFVVGDNYKLYIARKKSNFNRDKTNVDWGKSIKLLSKLAEKYNEELYYNFKSKDITKNEFIAAMKPYVYSDNTPNNPKWLIYNTSDYSSWLLISTFYSRCINKTNYGITPTNYINNINKSQIEYTNNCTKLNQIVDSKDLGFRDKIHCMERFDMDFCKRNWTQYN